MTARGQKYYPMRDSWVIEHASDLLIMEGHGWTFDHTGGGCTAMNYIHKDLFELVATGYDLDVPSSKRRDEMCDEDEMVCLGLYTWPEGASASPPITYKVMSWKTFIGKKAHEWFEILQQEGGV